MSVEMTQFRFFRHLRVTELCEAFYLKISVFCEKARTVCARFLFVAIWLFLTFHNFHRVFHIC